MALADNLLCFHNFDESSGNAADASGNGYTLTNVNSATFGAGKINNGGYLASASAQRFNSTAAGLAVSSSFSFSGWFYWTNVGQYYIAGRTSTSSTTATTINWYLYLNNGNTLEGGFCTSGGSVQNTTYSHIPSTGTWIHYGIVFDDSADTVKLYINGSNVATGTGKTGTPNGNSAYAYTIGSEGRGATYFNGRVDMCGYWNRALSDADMAELYNGGTGLQYPFTTSTFLPQAVFFE